MFRVRDTRWEREAALKLLKTPPQSSLEQEQARQRRFLREAKITARLNHPAVPAIHETGQTPSGQLYMLMSVVEGRTLGAEIQAAHELGLSEDDRRRLLEVFVKVAEALDYAHSLGILHRDLKPENIMVGQHGEVLVMDWGLAKILGQGDDDLALREAFEHSLADSDKAGLVTDLSLTQAGSFLGTPGYAAPEQIDGIELGPRSDVFSLACILSEILTGQRAIRGDSLTEICAVTASGVGSPRLVEPGLGSELDWIVRRAGEPDLKNRTASAGDLVAQVKAYLAGVEVPGYPYSMIERLMRGVRRWSTWIISATMLVLVLSLIGILLLNLERAKERTRRVALEKAQEQLKRTAAEAREREVQEQLDKARAVLEGFNKARRAAQRGAPEERVVKLVEETLKNSSKGKQDLLSAAEIYKQARLFERSLALLKRVVKAHPPAYEALYQWHELLLEEANEQFVWTAPITALLKEANKRGDENEYTLYAKALQLTKDEKYQEALEVYSKIEQFTEAFAPMYSNRGVLYGQLGKLDKSMADLDRVLELVPSYASAYLNRGNLWHGRKQYDKALADFQRAIELRPSFADAHFNAGNVCRDLKKWQTALEFYSKAIQYKPTKTEAYDNRASVWERLRKYQNALNDYQQALALTPKDPRLYNHRALLYHRLNQPQKALADYRAAIAADPEYAIAFFNRAKLYERLKQPDQALADLRSCLAVDPKFYRAYGMRGLILLARGDKQQAMQNYNKCLQLQPNFEGYVNRANLRDSQGDFEGALKDYNAAIELNSKNPQVYMERAIYWQHRKQPLKAIDDYSRAAALRPRDPSIYYDRGNLWLKQGQLQKAAQDFEQAKALNANYPNAYLGLGNVFGKAKRFPEALANFERFLRLEPNGRRAQGVRAVIQRIKGVMSQNK